jgi:hypothetical protein
LRQRSLERLGNLVDVLRLDDGVEIVFEQLCEVVLQLVATEVFEGMVSMISDTPSSRNTYTSESPASQAGH